MVPDKDGSVKEAEHDVQMSDPLKLEKLPSIKFFRASTHGCANRFLLRHLLVICIISIAIYY
jgi:hypothetical protein